MRIFKIFLVIAAIGITSSCGKMEMVPMKAKKLLVSDGETLRYGVYKNGELVSYYNEVSRVYQDEGIVAVYSKMTKPDNKLTNFQNYSNFGFQLQVSLKDASIVKYYLDNYSNLITDNEKGLAFQEITVNKPDSQLNFTYKMWDGYSLKTSSGRIGYNPKFPLWNLDSIGMIAGRFLDMQGRGVIYVAEPMISKSPVPVSFRFYGKETVETAAGKFNTVKIGGQVADPFLGKLLESFTSRLFFWIEDTDRRLMIKAVDVDGSEIILQEIIKG